MLIVLDPGPTIHGNFRTGKASRSYCIQNYVSKTHVPSTSLG